MADPKRSGSRRTAQVPPERTPSGTPPDESSFGQLHVFETIAALNRGFEQVLAEFERLLQIDLFRQQFSRFFVKLVPLTLKETRAWANFEVAEALVEHAQGTWARFGRSRRQWEKKLRDPNDVLIEAEQLKQKLRKAAARKARRPRPTRQ